MEHIQSIPQNVLEFDQPLPQRILNLEEKTRTSLFPWRGQFSPQLVECLLQAYCSRNAILLDPFSGGGTVLYEAGLRNLRAYGFEVNPAAWILSRTYEMINLPKQEREDLLASLEEKLFEQFPEPRIFEAIQAVQSSFFLEVLNRINSLASPLEKIVFDSLIILLDLANNELTTDVTQSETAG